MLRLVVEDNGRGVGAAHARARASRARADWHARARAGAGRHVLRSTNADGGGTRIASRCRSARSAVDAGRRSVRCSARVTAWAACEFCSPTITRSCARGCEGARGAPRLAGRCRGGRRPRSRAPGRAAKPDVAILDVAMPLLNGIEATRQIVKHVPGVRVLVLSMHADEAYVTQILQAGAPRLPAEGFSRRRSASGGAAPCRRASRSSAPRSRG